MTVQQQLDALNAAIGRGGILRVDFPDGGAVAYSSLSELIAARDKLQAEVNAANGLPLYNEIAFRRPC